MGHKGHVLESHLEVFSSRTQTYNVKLNRFTPCHHFLKNKRNTSVSYRKRAVCSVHSVVSPTGSRHN